MTVMAVFLFAAALDWLAVQWQKQRELGRRYRLAGISALMELAGWVPIWLAIATENPLVVVASVSGSALGAFLGAGPAQVRHGAEGAQGRSYGSCEFIERGAEIDGRKAG